MTTMSSMKFRSENDMSLSSTTQGLENHENPLGSPKAEDGSSRPRCRGQQGHQLKPSTTQDLENHENPLGSPKAEDGSSRPRCRGPQGHRLKPVKTKPASKAVLFGPRNVTKCMYLLVICTFVALMCGRKQEISHHRRLVTGFGQMRKYFGGGTQYNKVDDIRHMMNKLNGKTETIVGNEYPLKKKPIAERIYGLITETWPGNVAKLYKNAEKFANKKNETRTQKDFENEILPMRFAMNNLKTLIDHARSPQEKEKINDDSALMDCILNKWFQICFVADNDDSHLGSNSIIKARTIEIINIILLEQYECLGFTKAHITSILRLISAYQDRHKPRTCISFTGKFFEDKRLLKEFNKLSERSIIGSMPILKEAVKEAQYNMDSKQITAIHKTITLMATGAIEEATRAAIEEVKKRASMALNVLRHYSNMNHFLCKYLESDDTKPVYGMKFTKGDILSREDMILGFRLYVYCQEYDSPRPPKGVTFPNFCQGMDGKILIDAWALAVKHHFCRHTHDDQEHLKMGCNPRARDLVAYWSHYPEDDERFKTLEKARSVEEAVSRPQDTEGLPPPQAPSAQAPAAEDSMSSSAEPNQGQATRVRYSQYCPRALQKFLGEWFDAEDHRHIIELREAEAIKNTILRISRCDTGENWTAVFEENGQIRHGEECDRTAKVDGIDGGFLVWSDDQWSEDKIWVRRAILDSLPPPPQAAPSRDRKHYDSSSESSGEVYERTLQDYLGLWVTDARNKEVYDITADGTDRVTITKEGSASPDWTGVFEHGQIRLETGETGNINDACFWELNWSDNDRWFKRGCFVEVEDSLSTANPDDGDDDEEQVGNDVQTSSPKDI